MARRLLAAILLGSAAAALAPAVSSAATKDVPLVESPAKEASRAAEPADQSAPGEDTAAPAPTTGANFLAIRGGAGAGSESGFIPPDTTGAVGPSQVVVPLNGRIKVLSKAGAPQLTADLGLQTDPTSFFAPVLPAGATNFAFDPRVEYDRATGRWFVIAVNGGGDNRILIAVSDDAQIDSLTAPEWDFFQIVHSTIPPAGDAGEFADYPTLAVTPNSVLIGTNNFPSPGGSASRSLLVFDKSDLIGGTINATAFRNLSVFTPQPAENDGISPTEDYIVGVDDISFGQLNFYRLTYPGGTPTLSASTPLVVPPTSGSGDDVPQMGTATRIDALDDRLYEAMLARAPGAGVRLWTAHNMEVDSSGDASATGGRIGSRWYEFGTLSGNPFSPTLLQNGTLFDPAASGPDNFWVPSIATNGQGHSVLGSSVSGDNRFAGVALAQRFNGESAGTLSPPAFPQAGAGTYALFDSIGRNRWGDYSQLSIDPNDNMTFWAFQEYVFQGGADPDQWGVRVLEIPAPPPATPASASTGVVPIGQPSVNVQITGASSNGSGFYDPGAGFPDRIAASVNGGVAVNSITFDDPTHVTLDLNTTGATVGPKDVTITNPDGQTRTGNDLFTVSTPRTLTVSTAGTGTGTVTGPGISCPGDCTETVANGTALSLAATPAAGSTFDGFTGACTGAACNLTMDANKAVAASFTATGGGGGGGGGGGDGGGGGGGDGGGGQTPPSNDIVIRKADLNKKKGTAKLPVEVFAAGGLEIAGKGLKRAAKDAAGAGTVKLPVKPKGKVADKLDDKGKAKVTPKVSFTPTGGTENTESKKVTLKEK